MLSVPTPDKNKGKKVIKAGVPDKGDKDKDSKDNDDKVQSIYSHFARFIGSFCSSFQDDPEVAKLKAAISQAIVTEKPNVKWSDVAGLEQAKSLLKEVLGPFLLQVEPVRFPSFRETSFRPAGGSVTYQVSATLHGKANTLARYPFVWPSRYVWAYCFTPKFPLP